MLVFSKALTRSVYGLTSLCVFVEGHCGISSSNALAGKGLRLCREVTLFCFQNHTDFEKVNYRRGQGVCACVRAFMCVCVCVRVDVCVSVASHISETSEAIAIKFENVAASGTIMHHVLTILTLTFIQGHILIMKIINV